MSFCVWVLLSLPDPVARVSGASSSSRFRFRSAPFAGDVAVFETVGGVRPPFVVAMVLHAWCSTLSALGAASQRDFPALPTPFNKQRQPCRVSHM